MLFSPFLLLMSTWLSSNCVASLLQPSCYDSIIMIKKLPYLPDIIPSSSGAYSIFVEDFMMKVSTLLRGKPAVNSSHSGHFASFNFITLI
jgi:hypothetical protein